MLVGRLRSRVFVLYLSWSMCWSASYIQKGLSMVVHSFMNSIEPPVSADMSQMASSLQTGRRDGVSWGQSDGLYSPSVNTTEDKPLWPLTSVEIRQLNTPHSHDPFTRADIQPSACQVHHSLQGWGQVRAGDIAQIFSTGEKINLFPCEAAVLITQWRWRSEWTRSSRIILGTSSFCSQTL